MAILRESQAANPVTRANEPSIKQSSGGAVKQPNFRKFQKGPSTSDLILDAVVKVGTNLAGKAWENQQEEAYLTGVRQASEIESEEDLQSNIFTRSWTQAGFRDTQGKLKQSEFVASIPGAVQESLSKENPQQAFSDWMAQSQKQLTDSYSGMSRTARTASFAQNAMDIQAAQSTFTKEYAKAIINKKERALHSTFSASTSLMNSAKDDPKAYANAASGFMSNLYTKVWLDDQLPLSNKMGMTQEAILYASSNDHTAVYDMMKRQTFDFPDGTQSTLMQRLPMDEQIKLDKAHRQVLARTENIRGASFNDSLARMQVEWADPNGPPPAITHQELKGMLDQGMEQGFVTPGLYRSTMKSFYSAQAKTGGDYLLGKAFGAGDFPSIIQAGGDEARAAKAYRRQLTGLPIEEQVQAMLNSGLTGGMQTAFNEVGDMLNPSIRTAGYAQEMDVNSAQLVHGVVQGLDEAEKLNPGAYTRFLQSLSPENQRFMSHLRTVTRQGATDPLQAVQQARADIERLDKAGPASQALISQMHTENLKAVQEVGEFGTLGQISNYAKRFIGNQQAGAVIDLKMRQRWGEDAAVVAEHRAKVNLEVQAVLNDSVISQVGMPVSDRVAAAYADVANRSVESRDSPLIVPRGQTIQKFFAPADGSSIEFADSEYIGQALDSLYETPDGGRVVWNVTPDGARITADVYDTDRKRVGGGLHKPADIGSTVQELLDKDADKANQYMGDGKVVKHGNNQVRFNGGNTAGFDFQTMLNLRDEVVKFEGIRDNQYPDDAVVSGNMAYGVGISATNKLRFEQPMGRDGKYTQEQIDNSFSLASNDAAENAARVMKATGVAGPEWAVFFGELSYQSPASARSTELLSAIQSGDVEAAVAAFKKTNAYKNTKDKSRSEARINRLRKAMQ